MFNGADIRSDFPILSTEVYGKQLVYLDNGATAQKPRCVTECIERLHSTLNANVHRGVHRLSGEMTSLYEQARATAADFVGAHSPEEIIFTSGATASLNLVAYSWADTFIGKGDNVVVSELEHHSNLVPWQYIAARRGAELRMLPFDDEGRLMIERLDSILDSRTRLVAVTQASNTLGTMPDLPAIVAKAHAAGAVVVVDGCQGAVHGGVDVAALDCDFYAFSGHKLYAPTGIGVLYGRRSLLDAMPPFMLGGDMVDKVSFERTTFAPVPLKFEAGTANFIGAAALAEAIRYIRQFDSAEVVAYERSLAQYAQELLSGIDGVRIFGTQRDKCPIVSFDVEGVHNYDVGMILDKLGIAVRTGHHCAEPVMAHFGVGGMCRASFAMYNTRAEVEALAAGVERAAGMLRR